METQYITITGPMFSGKTTTLLQMADYYREQGYFTLFAKPAIDTRYSKTHIVSHDGEMIDCDIIKNSAGLYDFLEFAKGHKNPLVFIDEAQFLPEQAHWFFDTFIHRNGGSLCLAGLNLDAWGLPFGQMPNFVARALRTIHLEGICFQCSQPATRTIRLLDDKVSLSIAGEDEFQPGCFSCWQTVMRKRNHI